VTVRVTGKQPISEGGRVYHPARKGPEGPIAADTFEVHPDRVDALAGHVETVETSEE
jgi:hypothetical protein